MKRDKPSATAYLIAQSIVHSSYNSLVRHLIPDRAAEICEQFAADNSPLIIRLMAHRSFRFIAALLERATVPGISLHYILRKRFIEELARKEIELGCRQVVIIGAGFDTLALRLCAAYAPVNFIELDHPATQSAKVRVAKRDGLLRPNLTFHALDLTRLDDGANIFPEDSYQSGARTLFIAEGLLMYLTPAEIDRLLRCIHRQSYADSLLACTVMAKGRTGRIAFHNSSKLVDVWLRLRGESFRSGIERETASDFFSQRGYALRERADADTLRQRYLNAGALAPSQLASGEDICLAVRI